MEEEEGDIVKARELFQLGSEADPTHLYIWQVGCFWKLFLKGKGKCGAGLKAKGKVES